MSNRVNIHVNPEELLKGIQDHKSSTLDGFSDQLGSYGAAHKLVSSPDDQWFGGNGGTGRLPDASRQFLAWLAGKIAEQMAEQKELVDSFDRYLNGLAQFANNLRAADEERCEQTCDHRKVLGGR
ncbi:hypothetical protein [Amycolatopsis suaedae]|uniref:WXG100 family type VII secretion target n=1 Tax=Amycolatopsis suaedae TaxID=2510978 RepID=A0A4Q7IYR4_9PSEU|nr:hypothetical protein [Amycolatopsis suaedae]RZQ60130.1 hypothetical protein EWH70_31005 [Amycolatopsis suaedae]